MEGLMIRPGWGQAHAKRPEKILQEILREWENVFSMLDTAEDLERELAAEHSMKRRKILFVVSLDCVGMNLELYRMLQLIRKDPDCMEGSVVGILVDGQTELYTKAVAGEIALAANGSGCWIIGRPLVEGTGSLQNFEVMARNLECNLAEAYQYAVRDLVRRLMEFSPAPHQVPNILCLHSCNPETSNTLWLWKEVKEYLISSAEIQEISLRSGEVKDCAGCSFDTCMYYSRNSGCYYGGTIVEEVYPALERCDALVLLCPNYNDALGANLTALINRLTALFRKRPFFDKQIFALIVSGYSGGDLVARQLINGLNMNKSFLLPPRFALFQTANAPRSIARKERIEDLAKDFANHMKDCLIYKNH